MKVSQTIHKYPPHISDFERRYGIKGKNLSFSELQALVLEDGYASTYILKPALEGRSQEVFFTIWDYERLQYKWAEEKELKTRNLSDINWPRLKLSRKLMQYCTKQEQWSTFCKTVESI